MSKKLFNPPPQYDMAADLGRAFVKAAVVVACLIFCAGIAVGALLV